MGSGRQPGWVTVREAIALVSLWRLWGVSHGTGKRAGLGLGGERGGCRSWTQSRVKGMLCRAMLTSEWFSDGM